jgi:2,3-bisphosphoglycerate-independent phosphoglycerate mutase
MYSVGKGISPESDVAVLSILGYDPYKYHVGRGPLEAFGTGLEIDNGDLALRCNFSTLGKYNEIIDRRVGRNLTSKEASLLAETVNQKVKLDSKPDIAADFKFRNTLGHRAVLVIRSKNRELSGKITNTDPAYGRIEGLGVAKKRVEMKLESCKPLDDSEDSRLSALLVNEFTQKSHVILDKHDVNERRRSEGKLKANVVLTRDGGNRLPNFFDLGKHYNVSFACLADMPVERGISRLAGMHLIEIPPPSDDIKGDSILRAKELSKSLPSFDCFYIHIKGPDEPGHDGNFVKKYQIIESIDKFFFGNLLSEINLKNTLICITSDHATPCNMKSHSDNPVPLLITGLKIKSDNCSNFSEKQCAKGSIGLLEKGTKLMPILMNGFYKSKIS